MFMHKSKKGFTIVELVIVIAVIAILAAVLIPTFSNLVKKANQSADIQAARQMNTYLAANEILQGKTIFDALNALEEGGMDAEDYKPLTKDTYFFWDNKANRIVYTEYNSANGSYDVLFPADFVKAGQWFSLTSTIGKEAYDAPTVAGGITTVEISTSEELAQIVSDLKDITEGKKVEVNGFSEFSRNQKDNIYGVTGKIVIDLTRDIDFKGASFNINLYGADFTLNGNGYTISGISNASGFATSTQNAEKATAEYGAGIIGYATNSNITFNDVTIKDSYFGKASVKASAVFVGQTNDCNVTFNNTKVEDCVIKGLKGVAVYVGHDLTSGAKNSAITFTGTNSTKNCQIELCSTKAAEKDLVAVITGRTTIGTGKLTLTGAPTVENVTAISNKTTLATTPWYIKGNGEGAVVETSYNGSATVQK
jgi:prepilin-type N-terminal cleavage/methylation domain-containing protein